MIWSRYFLLANLVEMGNARARRQKWEKLVVNKWVFHRSEKSFYFLSKQWFELQTWFCVIISPKPQLSKCIFVLKINYFIWLKLIKNQKVWQMVCPSSWRKIDLFTPSFNLITLLFWQFSRCIWGLACFQSYLIVWT